MDHFINDLSILLGVVAVLSVIAVQCKQPIIIAYILCGVLIGPWGLSWIKDVSFINNISHLGITLLLFLAGLNLHPQKLMRLFKKTTLVTMGSCGTSFIMAFLFALLFKFSLIDSLCIGLALMFSSTILTVKLLPTTDLHHKHMGAVCIGVLIMEDLLAVAVLAFVRCLDAPEGVIMSIIVLTFKLAGFILVLFLFEQFVLRRVMRYVERLHEVLFILGLAWCFGVASISHNMGLFTEPGAFFAGVVLARQPISLFISEKLKPLRDFFLVLFFFTLGAKLDIFIMKHIFVPSLLLAGLFILIKPWLLKQFFIMAREDVAFAKEAGIRLGQLSEFSLLIAILAAELNHVTVKASQLIQLTTILTFIVSCYIIIFNYPTPIGTSDKLMRD